MYYIIRGVRKMYQLLTFMLILSTGRIVRCNLIALSVHFEGFFSQLLQVRPHKPQTSVLLTADPEHRGQPEAEQHRQHNIAIGKIQQPANIHLTWIKM